MRMVTCRRLLPILLAGLAALLQPMAWADEFRPAMLEIEETAPGFYSVLWKVPLVNGRPLPVTPALPAELEQMGPVSERTLPGERVQQSTWRGPDDGLVGSEIGIDGLSAISLDVIVRIRLLDGAEHSGIMRPSFPTYRVPERPTAATVALSYWQIGTIHILEGYDHLLFVLALLLIIPNLWTLLKTITAFTLAHSVSLALATLGLVNMPGAPTEAVIALSILFVAVEIVHNREGRETLTARIPWVVALVFGLIHGLGFAGALAEVGLPESDIPLALLMFNVGVETGQVLFVAVVVALLALLRRLPVSWPEGSWRIAPYAIGCIAAFWTVERVDSFLF